jgi:hypothetical protein
MQIVLARVDNERQRFWHLSLSRDTKIICDIFSACFTFQVASSACSDDVTRYVDRLNDNISGRKQGLCLSLPRRPNPLHVADSTSTSEQRRAETVAIF